MDTLYQVRPRGPGPADAAAAERAARPGDDLPEVPAEGPGPALRARPDDLADDLAGSWTASRSGPAGRAGRAVRTGGRPAAQGGGGPAGRLGLSPRWSSWSRLGRQRPAGAHSRTRAARGLATSAAGGRGPAATAEDAAAEADRQRQAVATGLLQPARNGGRHPVQLRRPAGERRRGWSRSAANSWMRSISSATSSWRRTRTTRRSSGRAVGCTTASATWPVGTD